MDTIMYTWARDNLAKTMKKVCEDREPIIITRKRNGAVVMTSLEALEETAGLLRGPKNSQN
jgi:antitoxin YefM